MVLHLQDCLALGVIFAATDSVAVLQVLKQDRSPLLYSLVFGEGVINDATAVALLRAVQVTPTHSLQMLRLCISWDVVCSKVSSLHTWPDAYLAIAHTSTHASTAQHSMLQHGLM